MRAHLLVLLERVRDGFWAIPAAAAVLAVVLGLAMPWVDRLVVDRGFFEEPAQWLQLLVFEAGGDGARATLAAVASSSITVAATVFSITIATLALVSSQYGPRLLRTFTTDRGVQVSLGMFVLAFVYPLLVLRTVRTEDEITFVPHLSVTVALVLGLAAVGTLIYFIDHLSQMVRAPQIVATVGTDLDRAMDLAAGDKHDALTPSSFHETDADSLDEPGLPDPDDPPAAHSRNAGYVTRIDHPRLVELARKRDIVLRLDADVGSYVYEGTALARRRPDDMLKEKDAKAIAEAFAIGARRTVKQDEAYAVNQLVEIALRAMSPGINDPFTAQSCVDRLTAGLVRISDRPLPEPYQRDDDGNVRLVTRRPTFAYLVEITYAPLRRYARGDAALLGRMLQALTQLAGRTRGDARRQAIAQQAAAIARCADELDDYDKQMLRKRHEAFERVLDGRGNGVDNNPARS